MTEHATRTRFVTGARPVAQGPEEGPQVMAIPLDAITMAGVRAATRFLDSSTVAIVTMCDVENARTVRAPAPSSASSSVMRLA
jgi:hypothetical protein